MGGLGVQHKNKTKLSCYHHGQQSVGNMYWMTESCPVNGDAYASIVPHLN